MTALRSALASHRYLWPRTALDANGGWAPVNGSGFIDRRMPERADELARDSRWPALFPSPMAVVTTSDGLWTGVERVVGPSIVNRFPYVLALSFCAQPLSARHHPRAEFMKMLEASGNAAVQFLAPGEQLDRVMSAIAAGGDRDTRGRISASGRPTRPAVTHSSPVFGDAYLVYEGRLVRPGRDFDGEVIYAEPWIDIGSHRVYYLEITAIELRRDIAQGHSQIFWRSLPAWSPALDSRSAWVQLQRRHITRAYWKAYTPHYRFPSSGTIAFEADGVHEGMAVKLLPPLPEDQVEVDNDRARWPCFFPSSVGMITTWAANGKPNLMPCGSTTVLSRHPMVITPCVSYAAINERYAPRASLELIRRNGAFACGVPYLDDRVLEAIRYAGNVSLESGGDKVSLAGLTVEKGVMAPILPALPVTFECRVVREVKLGTHVMFCGEVQRIVVRADVTPENPLEWCPWADVGPAGE